MWPSLLRGLEPVIGMKPTDVQYVRVFQPSHLLPLPLQPGEHAAFLVHGQGDDAARRRGRLRAPLGTRVPCFGRRHEWHLDFLKLLWRIYFGQIPAVASNMIAPASIVH